MVRWVFAVSAAMLVAGFIEYGVTRQHIIDRGLEDSRRNYEALAGRLEQVLADETDPLQREQGVCGGGQPSAAQPRHRVCWLV